MKKKIFGAAFIVVIAVMASIYINMNKVENIAGDLTLANVEALASGEQIGGCYWQITFHGSPTNYTCHDYLSGTYCCFF